MPVSKTCIFNCYGGPRTFVFPDEEKQNERRTEWLRLFGINQPTPKLIFACERHFSKIQFGYSKLRKHAVPDKNFFRTGTKPITKPIEVADNKLPVIDKMFEPIVLYPSYEENLELIDERFDELVDENENSKCSDVCFELNDEKFDGNENFKYSNECIQLDGKNYKTIKKNVQNTIKTNVQKSDKFLHINYKKVPQIDANMFKKTHLLCSEKSGVNVEKTIVNIQPNEENVLQINTLMCTEKADEDLRRTNIICNDKINGTIQQSKLLIVPQKHEADSQKVTINTSKIVPTVKLVNKNVPKIFYINNVTKLSKTYNAPNTNDNLKKIVEKLEKNIIIKVKKIEKERVNDSKDICSSNIQKIDKKVPTVNIINVQKLVTSIDNVTEKFEDIETSVEKLSKISTPPQNDDALNIGMSVPTTGIDTDLNISVPTNDTSDDVNKQFMDRLLCHETLPPRDYNENLDAGFVAVVDRSVQTCQNLSDRSTRELKMMDQIKELKRQLRESKKEQKKLRLEVENLKKLNSSHEYT